MPNAFFEPLLSADHSHDHNDVEVPENRLKKQVEAIKEEVGSGIERLVSGNRGKPIDGEEKQRWWLLGIFAVVLIVGISLYRRRKS